MSGTTQLYLSVAGVAPEQELAPESEEMKRELELAGEPQVAARPSSSDPSDVPTGSQAHSSDERTDNEAPSASRPGTPDPLANLVLPVATTMAGTTPSEVTPSVAPNTIPTPPHGSPPRQHNIRLIFHGRGRIIVREKFSPSRAAAGFPPLPGPHANSRLEARCNGVSISADVYVPPEYQTPTQVRH